MSQNKNKKGFRRKLLWLIPLFILLYLIGGAVSPFMKLKKTGTEKRLLPALASMAGDEEGEMSVDRVMLLESNESAWEERLRLMNQARERIIISTFDMREGESTRDLLAMLVQKAEEGVRVQIIVDGFSGTVRMRGKKLFEAAAAHPGIEIRHYNPINLLKPWMTQGRMHDKYVIVDDLGYILGGRNMFDYFIGNYDASDKGHDREVLIYNSAHETERSRESSLYQVENYFKGIWDLDVSVPFADGEKAEADVTLKEERELLMKRLASIKEERPDLFETPEYGGKTYAAAGICLLSNSTGVYGKEPDVFFQLTELMKEAGKETLIHTPYLVCNDYMRETLMDVQKQTPELKIMFNSVENGDNFFASSDYMRQKGKLLKMGIPLYEYDGGFSAHAKSVVIGDDISAVGSYNFDLRSSYVDTELMLVIKSRELTKELRVNMEKLEQDCRRPISLTEYETPPHITVQKVPPVRMAAMKIVGFFMQPFRFLI